MTGLANQIRYLPSHEWGRIDEEEILTVGISNHAQDLLGDIVFIELPEIGKQLDAEEESAIVESVKAASEIYTPISGEIIEVNEKLETEPELLNNSPYEEGWLIKVKISDLSEIEKLMNSKDYENFVNNGN